MIKLLLLFLLFTCFGVYGQPAKYTTANAHSHNDYEHANPFWEAYNAGFGSIEADIFLVKDNDELLVAHTLAEIATKKRRLDSSYLIPIRDCIRKNHGHPYAEPGKNCRY